MIFSLRKKFSSLENQSASAEHMMILPLKGISLGKCTPGCVCWRGGFAEIHAMGQAKASQKDSSFDNRAVC